jgi:hypothetical protein
MTKIRCYTMSWDLTRHAAGHRLPHPGLVALDSPLVAYREPDSQDPGAQALIAADVKSSFYRSLASGLAGVQVIIFENEDPPEDVAAAIGYVHFSKTASGRYGFLPIPGIET